MNWTVAPLLISSLGLSDPGLPFSGSFQSADGLRLSQWGFVCYYCSWDHPFLGTNFFFKDYPFFFPPSQPPSLISWNQCSTWLIYVRSRSASSASLSCDSLRSRRYF